MTVSDPIADLLTRIRNGIGAKQRFVDIPFSKIKVSILEILKDQGFIKNFVVNRNAIQGTVRVYLKYQKRESVINGIKRVSKPGLRKYVSKENIPRVLGGMGLPILTTSEGVIDGETAKNKNIGGEVLCFVW